jgi:preprotein translocase subunit SecA
MKDRIDEEMVRYLWRLRPVVTEPGQAPVTPAPRPARPRTPVTLSGGSATAAAGAAVATAGAPRPARTGGDDAAVTTVRREEPKIGRNDPCWCGSGKKYKKCHGA